MVTLLKLAFSADKVKCPIHKDYVELDHLVSDNLRIPARF